ncbi:340_t:CDS:2, partial [Dentiscutata heterogama]
LPLILVVNIAGINITDKGFYLEYKDLPEEISFSSENTNIKQSNYHIANIRFENIKNH